VTSGLLTATGDTSMDGTAGAPNAFRMGPPYDSTEYSGYSGVYDTSWGDDIIDASSYELGQFNVTQTPTGPLPEVPFAAILPVILLAGYGVVRKRLK
ncbi:MAG: hypothetical protein OWU32_11630, partial [Firmicutes bacterium]|nr:hypothetical protein [Bacillota bacterium]